ncbi:MAG TPA: Crp/Fnr family transcriptional regulator [Bacteroidales bacterium]|nr:Crp/Fnr family transcriptional regulator [Bacteroidales bacterium]
MPSHNVLSPLQIDRINNNALIVNHKKGEIIFRQDKPVSHLLFLRSGLVKIYKEGLNKKTVILKIIGPDNYVGAFSAFYDNRYQMSGMTLEDSELIYININIFKEILSENGSYALQLLQDFSNEGMYLINKLMDFPQKLVPGRIAEVLMFFGTEVYKNKEFTLPISRQELADLVYSTKESVSRTLTEFKNDRIIEIEDRKVTLQSVDLLKILSKLG